MKNIKKTAFINAAGTVLYVAVVASFIVYAPKFESGPISVFVPMAMLLLFIFSAALTGFLIFGRPILWYLDGNKKEALSLLAWTLAIFLVITLAVFVLLLYRFYR